MGQALNAAPPDLPGLFAVVQLHSAWRMALWEMRGNVERLIYLTPWNESWNCTQQAKEQS